MNVIVVVFISRPEDFRRPEFTTQAHEILDFRMFCVHMFTGDLVDVEGHAQVMTRIRRV